MHARVIKSIVINTLKKIWFGGKRIYIKTNLSEIYSCPLEAFLCIGSWHTKKIADLYSVDV